MTKIILNDQLVEDFERTQRRSAERAINAVANESGVFDDLNWKTERVVPLNALPPASFHEKNLFGLLSASYSHHLKVTITPTDVWFLLLTEIAGLVTANAETCRPLFTRSPGKIEIMVPTGDVSMIDLNEVMAQLRGLVPVDIDTFLPVFSTDTPASQYACVAAFCETVKSYYSYMTFCCGIPAVEVAGTKADWERLDARLSHLTGLFASTGLDINGWMARVRPIIARFIDALDGRVDVDFWRNIFTQKNIGSGGELLINGWITTLVREIPDMPKITNFPKLYAVVPYKNAETGRNFFGVHGGFCANRNADGFHSLGYAEIIMEKVARE